jgi:sporulation protein YlmC with PRC-barrel domain
LSEVDVELVRDLLDKLVLDRNGREMGRVDGIVLELRDGTAPRVAALEIGPSVLGTRLHPVIGRFVAGIEQAFGVAVGRPVRIAFSDVTEIATDIKVDLSIGETAAGNVEQRLRAWIGRIPGAG